MTREISYDLAATVDRSEGKWIFYDFVNDEFGSEGGMRGSWQLIPSSSVDWTLILITINTYIHWHLY